MKIFNFRIIDTPDGNQIIDRTLKTPLNALTPLQMLEYNEMDNRLAYMDRRRGIKKMYKWMYDRMVTEYSKESKEELVKRIMSLEEIECSDRCFANQCMAGTSMYNINELFSALEDMQSGFTYEKAARVYELMEIAKGSWKYIRNGIEEMNDNSRCGKTLDDFKLRVLNAKDSNDSI